MAWRSVIHLLIFSCCFCSFPPSGLTLGNSNRCETIWHLNLLLQCLAARWTSRSTRRATSKRWVILSKLNSDLLLQWARAWETFGKLGANVLNESVELCHQTWLKTRPQFLFWVINQRPKKPDKWTCLIMFGSSCIFTSSSFSWSFKPSTGPHIFHPLSRFCHSEGSPSSCDDWERPESPSVCVQIPWNYMELWLWHQSWNIVVDDYHLNHS